MNDNTEVSGDDNCEHTDIEWSSVTSAETEDGVIDVWCKCGHSGSVRIDPKDIQW